MFFLITFIKIYISIKICTLQIILPWSWITEPNHERPVFTWIVVRFAPFLSITERCCSLIAWKQVDREIRGNVRNDRRKFIKASSECIKRSVFTFPLVCITSRFNQRHGINLFVHPPEITQWHSFLFFPSVLFFLLFPFFFFFSCSFPFLSFTRYAIVSPRRNFDENISTIQHTYAYVNRL